MSKNWHWHHSTWPIHQPRLCPAGCGKIIRRIGKHLNQKHPDW